MNKREFEKRYRQMISSPPVTVESATIDEIEEMRVGHTILMRNIFSSRKLWDIIKKLQSMDFSELETWPKSGPNEQVYDDWFAPDSLLVSNRYFFTNFVHNPVTHRIYYLVLDGNAGQEGPIIVEDMRMHTTGLMKAQFTGIHLKRLDIQIRMPSYRFINWNEDPFEEVKG